MAIISRLGGSKLLMLELSCEKCSDRIRFYHPLDCRSRTSEKFREAVLLASAGDTWDCNCGKTKIPLRYMKEGVHALFRRMDSLREKKELNFIPSYQKGAVAAIIADYQRLLVDYADDEETVVKFVVKTPILWDFLAPTKIWIKPPILTKYKTDFGILTSTKVLYFVEIEKPKTKLVKTNGGIHSELQAGLDQIRDWRIEVEKHRGAVLDGLGLTQGEVHDIRYMLIAGMARATSAKGLAKIRGMRDVDSIYCFDELATFLYSTETALLNV